MGKSKFMKRKPIAYASGPGKVFQKAASAIKNALGFAGKHPFRIASNKIAKLRQARRARLQSKPSFRAEPFGVSGPGSQTEFSYPFVPTKMGPVTKAVAHKTYVGTAIATDVTTAVGVQGYSNVAAIFTPTDIGVMFGENSITTEQKILFKSHYTEVMISNPLNVSIRVKLYDIENREDVDRSTIGTPSLAINLSAGDAAGGTATVSAAVLGTNPLDITGWQQQYRIVNVTDLLLQGGQVHIHKVKGSPNRIVDSDRTKYSAYGIEGLTRWVLMQQYGTPGNDSMTLTQVSTLATRLNVISTTTYRYSVFNDAATRLDAGATVPSAFTHAANFEEMYVEGAEVAATT